MEDALVVHIVLPICAGDAKSCTCIVDGNVKFFGPSVQSAAVMKVLYPDMFIMGDSRCGRFWWGQW